MNEKDEGKLIANIEFIKEKISCLPCKKQEERIDEQESKINKLTVFLAVLTALTLGGTAFRLL